MESKSHAFNPPSYQQMNYIPFDPSISQKILIVIKYVIEGFYFIMNPLILYDLLLLPLSHFIRTWSGVGGNGIFFFISQMDMLDHISIYG